MPDAGANYQPDSQPPALDAVSDCQPSVAEVCAFFAAAHNARAAPQNGLIFAWGDGDEGKLGIGRPVSQEKPTMVDMLMPSEFADAGRHSLVLLYICV